MHEMHNFHVNNIEVFIKLLCTIVSGPISVTKPLKLSIDIDTWLFTHDEFTTARIFDDNSRLRSLVKRQLRCYQ